MNKDCEVCGKSLGDVVFHRKYCLECHDKRQKQLQFEYRQRKKAGADAVKICKFCGAETTGDLRMRCPKCADVLPPTKYKGKPEAEPKPPKPKRKKPLKGCWDLDNKSAVQVDIEARALGLSYGQYTSLVGSLFIERFLASQGITDGLERIATAWKLHKKRKRDFDRRLKAKIALANAEMEMEGEHETGIHPDDALHSHY